MTGCQVRTLLEDVAEDILPNGLPSLSSSLIGEGSMSSKPCRGITNHKSGKGVKAFSSLPISRQWFIFDLVAPLCMGKSYGRWSNRGVGRELHSTRSKSRRPLINFHWQGVSTWLHWLHIARVKSRIGRTETDSLNTFFKEGRSHLWPTAETQLQLRTTASCLVKQVVAKGAGG